MVVSFSWEGPRPICGLKQGGPGGWFPGLSLGGVVGVPTGFVCGERGTGWERRVHRLGKKPVEAA